MELFIRIGFKGEGIADMDSIAVELSIKKYKVKE